MKEKVKKIIQNKDKTIPILSFPAAQCLGISVNELISSSDRQAEGMEAIAARCSIGASLNMMDLSVEAECFGAKVRFYESENPTVEKGIIDDISQAPGIVVPEVGSGRTGIYIKGVEKAKRRIKDIPVFCGVIGPYSLAGRLFDMTELMMACFDDPDNVAVLLGKTEEFLIEHIRAYKEAGADGVIMAEPAAGLLSPSLAGEFSTPYVKRIFDAVRDDDFVVCYHNCGNTVVDMTEQISSLDADILHFGNAVRLADMIPRLPSDVVVMGNVDPVLFKNGGVQDIRDSLQRVYDDCHMYDNFMISSGCDIPAAADWKNIDAYFEMVRELYRNQTLSR